MLNKTFTPLLVAGLFQLICQAADSPDLGKPTESEQIRNSLHTQYQALWAGMSPDAQAGYQHLVNNVYLPPDFDEDVLQKLDTLEHPWKLSDAPLNTHSRTSTWTAYGLAPRPDDPSKPLQYVVTKDQRYVMNCFACHGGSLFGTTYPGAPNTTYQLETLTEQVRKIKLSLGKPLGHMDVGSVFMPLGKTVGSSNAVMFGVALMNFRDKDLNVHTDRMPAEMINHDMDAPPWWHFHRKHHIYIDGFAEKGHRGLMQFMLVKQNGPEQFRSWEKDFSQVYQFISELRPPKYPLPIDPSMKQRGEQVFASHCASCHGTYGEKSTYPEIRVPIEEIGTDRVRLDALTPKNREHYGQSWFANYGGQDTIANVDGYVAPPLDGIWASAPYLHNGSVPTLWHLLNPDQRPELWRRTELGLDCEKMGLLVETPVELPKRLKSAERRWYFDTKQPGKSATGHDYPNALTQDEKIDLLEYLKSL
ncbi:MAG: cytochrome c [Planctomycetota bacterium]|nr:cytochrome c [Planctomycetota bacterium]